MKLAPFRAILHSAARRSIPRALICCAYVSGLFGFVTETHAGPPPAAQKKIQIYFVDVEGGQATLFVTPAGESLLIDTGWPGNEGRDADRIVAAAKEAGTSKIDFVVITHYHTDHGGGAPQLAARIPVKTFIDHGENRKSTDQPTVEVWQAYQKLLSSGKYKRIIAKPGMDLPIHGMRATVISSDGDLISSPVGPQENPSPD